MDDWQCLRKFVADGSQEAFSSVVSAHLSLVYSAALRQVRDRHLAEDVTQSVFLVLARKAKGLRPGASLAAWLLVTTRYLALDALDARARRERHEREAAAMANSHTPPIDPAQWDAMSPHLDAALASLSGKDREAIALRYFQDRSFKEVAQAMGMTVETARQRVHRATMRMRAFFATRGAPVALEAIGPMILAHAVHAAPAGLAISATAAVAADHAVGGALTGKGTVLLMALTKTKIAIGAAALLLLSGGALVAYKAAAPPAERVVVLSGPAITIPPAITPAPTADWEARLNQAYGLADGQNVKQIPTPLVAERQLYWNKTAYEFSLPANVAMTFQWDGSKLECRTFSPGPGRLSDFLSLCDGIASWQVDSSVPVAMKFPGDWVARKGASTQKLMEELGLIVSAKLGRAVRFELRRVVREAVVARGTYHFAPLSGHKDDGIIVMVADKPAPFPLHAAQSMSLRQFVQGLEKYTYCKVFVEVDSPAQVVKVREGSWSGDGWTIMRNFAAQTSLHFDREPREVVIWFMTDASPATRPNSI